MNIKLIKRNPNMDRKKLSLRTSSPGSRTPLKPISLDIFSIQYKLYSIDNLLMDILNLKTKNYS